MDPFSFPRKLDGDIWETYLDRSLNVLELHRFELARKEKFSNWSLKRLYEKIIFMNLTPVTLVPEDGDCFFSSLNALGIGKGVMDLREGLAYLMYLFRDYKGFFPKDDQTLKEKFTLLSMDESPKFVFCKKVEKVYKYSYELMCQDLADKYSWTKLPMDLIMLVLSALYKIELLIIRDDAPGFTLVNAFDNVPEKERPPIKRINLGYLRSFHYIPLRSLEEGESFSPIFDKRAKQGFIKWAKRQERLKQKAYLMQFT